MTPQVLAAVFATSAWATASVTTPPPGAKPIAAPPPVVTAVTTVFLPPTIDGRLDEAVWRAARPISEFTQDEPHEGAAPTERTEVVLAIDAHAVYLGARLYDSSPPHIRARLCRRDEEVAADYFLFFLDPDRDKRSGVYFGVNAAGTQYDGTMSNDTASDGSWDGVWESGVARDGAGWSLEMRIPLSQLRFEGSGGGHWGVNFERFIERKREHDLLVHTPRTETGFVSRFADLVGVEAVAAPARFEAVPYVSGSASWHKREPGDPFADDRRTRARIGLDLKLGLGGRLTLDGTVFPDFGQVEVDPAVINLSDVETFYPEKRPFFVEGASIFNDFGRGGASGNWNFDWPSPDMFYSRRIGRAPGRALSDDLDFTLVPEAADILGAAKLTGQIGEWSIGSVAALTAAETARVSQGGVVSDLPVEPLTAYGVVRVHRALRGGRHGVGLLGTMAARDLADPGLAAEMNKTAGTFGVDGWTSIDAKRTYVLHGWVSASQITGTAEQIASAQRSSARYMQRPLASHLGVDDKRTSLGGYAGRLAMNKQSGRVLANAAVGVLSPGYEINDLGFLGVTDVINAHAGIGYRWPDPGRFLRSQQTMVAAFGNWDLGGTKTGGGYFASYNFELLNYWDFWSNTIYFPETTNVRRTRGGPPMLNTRGAVVNAGWNSDLNRPLAFGGRGGYERFARRANQGYNVGVFAIARIADRASVTFEPDYASSRGHKQYLDTEDDPGAVATFGKRYLFGDLEQRTFSANVRASFIFTPRLSFQLYAQPLVSSLKYHSVNALAAPHTFLFDRTDEDPNEYSKTVLSLRGSAVLRWEYLPGSTLYLVWSGNQGREDRESRFALASRLHALADLAPQHVFMAKLSYWWGW